MNTIVIGRIAKFVALFGFFLPWAVFSCSGQEFAMRMANANDFQSPPTMSATLRALWL